MRVAPGHTWLSHQGNRWAVGTPAGWRGRPKGFTWIISSFRDSCFTFGFSLGSLGMSLRLLPCGAWGGGGVDRESMAIKHVVWTAVTYSAHHHQ